MDAPGREGTSRRHLRGARRRGLRPLGHPSRHRRGPGQRGLPLHLAGDSPSLAGTHQEPQQHHRVREQPPVVRAAGPEAERTRPRGARPGPPRIRGPRASHDDRGEAQDRRPQGHRRDLQPGARHRHGGGGPRAPDRESRQRGPRPSAGRSSGSRGGSAQRGPHLPEVPRGPARGSRRRPAHAPGADRGDPSPSQSAGCPESAAGRDGLHGRLEGRRRTGPGQADRELLRADPGAVSRRPRHAQWPLPQRGLRRASPSHSLGPRHRHPARTQGQPHAGSVQRRHHPGPRPVHGPRRFRDRAPGGRAGRGDGLRVPPRSGLHAGGQHVAHSGDYPRPGGRDPGSRRAWPNALLARAGARTADRAGTGSGRVQPRTRGPLRRGRHHLAAGADPTGRARGEEPGRLRPGPEGGDRGHSQRPHPGRRALSRRPRRLAGGHPQPVREPRSRTLGPGHRRHPERAHRPGRAVPLDRRRHPASLRGCGRTARPRPVDAGPRGRSGAHPGPARPERCVRGSLP